LKSEAKSGDMAVLETTFRNISLGKWSENRSCYRRKEVDRKKPPPPGGFPIYYVPRSRTRRKRTPLEAPGTNSSRGVLFLRVLDQGT